MKNKFSPNFFMDLVNHLPGMIFWKDANGVFLGCNDAFVRSLGLSSKDEVIGRTDSTLPIKVVEAESFQQDDLEVMRTNQPKLNIEEEQTFADGRKAYLLTNKVPLTLERNGVDGVLGIYSDITELKLTQQNLQQEKQKAEIASKSKSEFIANMSHDLRTPITGMLGMVHDMISCAEQAKVSTHQSSLEQTKQALQFIVETVLRDGSLLISATNELLHLCNEILEVTKIESGSANKSVESFDLFDLVNHNIKLLQPSALHKRIKLVSEIDASMPRYLKGHRIYLDRILLNLIGNGVKFTEAGEVKIAIKLVDSNEVTLTNGKEVILQVDVQDTGIGIPEDKFDEIFENFSRLTPSYEGLYKGAGLGLYTVKRYVEAMGGTLTLTSKVGKGTCFTLTLPFSIAKPSTQPSHIVTRLKQDESYLDQILIGKQSSALDEDTLASILVVEDNKLAAIAVMQPLKSFCCRVDIALDGSKALKMAAQNKYDLILIDIGLPDFSGVEATEKIRGLSDHEKSKTPIVALTGHADNPVIRQQALDAGMQDVLIKPVRPCELELILNKYVLQPELPPAKANKLQRVIDWSGCIEKCNDDPEWAEEMLSLLADDLKKTKKVIEKSFANNDLDALNDELHRALGGVCYLKVPQLEMALKSFQQTIIASPQNKNEIKADFVMLTQTINEFWREWDDFNQRKVF